MLSMLSWPSFLSSQENNILLDKLIRIKNTQTEKTFRPWLGRSTFQWSPGLYYDSITNTK